MTRVSLIAGGAGDSAFAMATIIGHDHRGWVSAAMTEFDTSVARSENGGGAGKPTLAADNIRQRAGK
ncbi:MAG: hypothetical protein WCE30_13655 [Mycobacterium sp.]